MVTKVARQRLLKHKLPVVIEQLFGWRCFKLRSIVHVDMLLVRHEAVADERELVTQLAAVVDSVDV